MPDSLKVTIVERLGLYGPSMVVGGCVGAFLVWPGFAAQFSLIGAVLVLVPVFFVAVLRLASRPHVPFARWAFPVVPSVLIVCGGLAVGSLARALDFEMRRRPKYESILMSVDLDRDQTGTIRLSDSDDEFVRFARLHRDENGEPSAEFIYGVAMPRYKSGYVYRPSGQMRPSPRWPKVERVSERWFRTASF